MTSRTAALRYARALFDVAVKEQADLEAIEQQLDSFVGQFKTHELLGRVLLNPAVPAPRKRAVVSELLKRTAMASVVSKTLVLLAERDRLVLLPEILEAYRQRVLDHHHIVRARVTTAMPLSGERAQAIEQRLAQATGRRVALATSVDPAIIGGAVTRIGSTVYDGSVTRQLERMKQKLEQA